MSGYARVGIDVGGTFTDFVLSRGDGSPLVYHKEPSTPAAPSRAVVSGFGAVVALAGIAPEDIGIVAHGTTIGLNAILQRRAAPTGLVVSAGSRDILELARCKISNPLNIFSRPDAPLVPRTHVVETAVRLDRRGDGAWADDAELGRVAAAFAGLEIETCAVALVNAYRRPDVELDFAHRLSALLGVGVTSSCEIWPEIREYERAMVAVMNAAVSPLIQRYLDEIEAGLADGGFGGSLLITTSNGGTIPLDVARRRPVDTLLSGPAAGVVAAAREAGRIGAEDLITVDMGGTSSDMSVVTGAAVEYSTRAQIGDFPLFVPVVSVSAIGAGGGSILRVDEHGVLKVGPQSAGADPGPIAYGRGGVEPTLTDCFLVCGYLARDQYLGGSVGLAWGPAREALARIGDCLGYTGDDVAERAAWAAIRVATAKMATELRKGLAERGVDQSGYALMPFGGAGPVAAALLAEEARLSRISIPEAPGTFCALGAMLGDLKRDFSRTVRQSFGAGLSSHLRAVLGELRAEATAWLEAAGNIVSSREFVVMGAMRYSGQSYELSVPLDQEVLAGNDDTFVAAFHAEHRRRYGFIDEGTPVALTSIQLTAEGRLGEVERGRAFGGATVAAVPRTVRPVYVGGAWHDAAIFERADLPGGALVEGPAVVTQKDTTTLLPPGWRAAVDPDGALLLTRGLS